MTAGTLSVIGFVGSAIGSAVATSLGGDTASTIWNVIRWPVGIVLLMAASAMVFRWAPRRRPARLVVAPVGAPPQSD